jgi:hypothetical protein
MNTRLLAALVLAALLPAVTGCRVEPPQAGAEAPSAQDPSPALVAHLPDRAPGGWQAVGPAKEYTSASLFEYIDGGAAFYLGYDFRGCAVRRYRNAGEEVTVELYDMSTPADAYGVFHWDMAAERPPVGDGACYEAGLLKLWSGQFFVRLLAEREREGTRAGLVALAQRALASLPSAEEPPLLIRRAENAGLAADSLRYFHRLETLHAIRYDEAWQHLGLSAETEAVWGDLEEGGSALMIRYPTADEARRAASATKEALAREGVEAFAIARSDTRLVIVLGTGVPAEAQAAADRLAALI